MSSPITQALKAEFKENLLVFWRAFWKSTLVVAALLLVVALVSILRGESPRDAANPIFLIVLAGYSLVAAALVGGFIGFLRLAWHVAGWWLILILVLIPLTFKLVFWVLSGTLAGEVTAIKMALEAKSAATDWLDVGPAARIGPIALVIILPIIAVKALGVLFSPAVLGALAVYVITVMLGLIISFFPSLLLTLIIFTARIGKRVKDRYTTMNAQ